jgi:hypothetical protein
MSALSATIRPKRAMSARLAPSIAALSIFCISPVMALRVFLRGSCILRRPVARRTTLSHITELHARRKRVEFARADEQQVLRLILIEFQAKTAKRTLD